MFWISWVHQLVKGQAPLKLWSFLLLDFWLFISTLVLNFILFILEVHSLSVGLIIRLSNFTETLPFNEFFFSHYHKFAITSYSSSKLVLFTSNFSKKLDPNWEFQKICYLREPLVLIVVMEGFYFDTQESELELVGYTRPTKAPWKDKNVRCIVNYVHLSSMAASYNHHFIFFNRVMNNATQLIPS